MSALALVAACVLPSAALFALWRLLRTTTRQAWGDAVLELGGLQSRFDGPLRMSFELAPFIAGMLDGVSVRVAVEGRGGARHTRISAVTEVPAGFGFRPRTSGTTVELTGDPAFDAAVKVEGAAVACARLLDEPLRKRILAAMPLRVVCEDGEVVVRQPGVLGDAAALARVVRIVADLARRLADAHRQDGVERLVASATRDPEPGARRRALRVLIDHHREDPAAHSALDRALLDPNAEVRVLGAAGLGSSGFEAMCSIATDAALPNAVRASALERLVTIFSKAQTVPVLMKALDDRSSHPRRVAISALGRMRHAPALPRLLQLGARAQDAGELAALADALGRLPDPRAEEALLALLERDDPGTRVHAARNLGRIGSGRAVERLRALTAGLFAGELKRVATESIDQIQARVASAGGAEGQLAVVTVDEDEGAVSLPPQDGALALAETPGSVSLAAPRKVTTGG